MSPEVPTPATTLSATDHGDDMQRRVRYQSAYGAWVALGLLLDETDIVEIYCEHHEDILLRKKNGKYHGCQVKTRLSRLGPFKTDDLQIKSSISRFIELEKTFSDHFERFIIASNVSFWQTEKNGKNLPHLIQLAHSLNGFPKPSISNEIRELVSEWCDKHKCKRDLVWRVLDRLELQPDLPHFSDIERYLATKIADALQEPYRRYDELQKAAKGLVQLISEASSLAHQSQLLRYFVFVDDPKSAEEASIIAGKRISKKEVLNAIRQYLNTAVLLTSGNRICLADLPRGTKTLEKKMAAGGINVAEISLLKDLQNSADVLLQQWFYKYGESTASERYDHVRLIVTEDCYEAAASAKSDSELYGAKMLGRVRSNLKTSFQHQSQQLTDLGVSYQHLLGVAGMLTEDCKVWWSDEFDLTEGEEEDAAESVS